MDFSRGGFGGCSLLVHLHMVTGLSKSKASIGSVVRCDITILCVDCDLLTCDMLLHFDA